MVYDRDEIPFIMTVPELAKVMRINVTKAYQLVKIDGFPYIRMGKKILVPKEAFLRWQSNIDGIIF